MYARDAEEVGGEVGAVRCDAEIYETSKRSVDDVAGL
jgi:hypothetical protein